MILVFGCFVQDQLCCLVPHTQRIVSLEEATAPAELYQLLCELDPGFSCRSVCGGPILCCGLDLRATVERIGWKAAVAGNPFPYWFWRQPHGVEFYEVDLQSLGDKALLDKWAGLAVPADRSAAVVAKEAAILSMELALRLGVILPSDPEVADA